MDVCIKRNNRKKSDDKVALIMISTEVPSKEELTSSFALRSVTLVSPLCDEAQIRLLFRILP